MRRWTCCTTYSVIIAGLFVSAVSSAFARKLPKRAAEQEHDQIDVVGHVALDGKGVISLLTGQHWRRHYLYLNSAEKVIAVDVTDGEKPRITSEFQFSTQAAQHQPLVVVGDAALISDQQPPSTVIPRSISIMSFAHPAKPTVVRQFVNVTGFLNDIPRGLMYVVNDEGLWILYKKPARDLEEEKEYERYLRYNR